MGTSIATLNNIIRSTALGEIAQNSPESAQSGKERDEGLHAAQALALPSAPLFFDKAHDQFLSKLHDDFKARYGLEISNIRIEQFKILDEVLSQSVAGQAVKTAAAQAELAVLEAQRQIATQKEHLDAALKQQQAESEARMQQTKADSEKRQVEALAAAQQVRSDMEANAKRIQAQAEADVVRTQAQAEAEAISLKAKAEGERATMLAATPLGEKLSLLEMYGDVVKTSNAGVDKIVYVDPSTTQGGNPFSLLTLQSLQKDMVELNSVGK